MKMNIITPLILIFIQLHISSDAEVRTFYSLFLLFIYEQIIKTLPKVSCNYTNISQFFNH